MPRPTTSELTLKFEGENYESTQANAAGHPPSHGGEEYYRKRRPAERQSYCM